MRNPKRLKWNAVAYCNSLCIRHKDVFQDIAGKVADAVTAHTLTENHELSEVIDLGDACRNGVVRRLEHRLAQFAARAGPEDVVDSVP
jgi:hypothetical protein